MGSSKRVLIAPVSPSNTILRIAEPSGITGTPLLSDDGTGPVWVDSDDLAGSGAAADVTVADSGGYYTGTDVEAVLQEVGAALGAGGSRAAGSSFPGSPSSGDLFYRTDLKLEFVYDGTRWLSISQYEMDLSRVGDSTEPATATKNAIYWEGLLQTIYIETLVVGFYVAGGGSALGASHKWVGTLTVWDSGGSQGSAIATINVDSGSSSVFRALSATGVNTATAATDVLLSWNITKTGTPGNFYGKPRIIYRLIAT